MVKCCIVYLGWLGFVILFGRIVFVYGNWRISGLGEYVYIIVFVEE